MNSVVSDKKFIELSSPQKIWLSVFALSLFMLFVALFGGGAKYPKVFLISTFGIGMLSGIVFIRKTYAYETAGIKNNFIMMMKHTAKGSTAWFFGILFTSFYVCLYWHADLLENLVRMVDPISYMLRAKAADQWFLYGTFYTACVLVMGYRMLLKYRHSRYQTVRTLSVMFFQLVFSYLIPSFLAKLNQPEFYFTYFWPLKYDALFPGSVASLRQSGNVGVFMLFWSVAMIAIATPLLTYFYGKRWYCSWVCGCGGLAETLGDPYRQLSDKSLKAWKTERVMIYSVTVLITITTILVWLDSVYGGGILGTLSASMKKWYGFFIGAAFSGVIGVGFYPLLGSRVWCRFGCPMAAILGILQKWFSKFRITTNGGQCISCGNCSTYCEMGIDVRWYAQRGQDISRASCVGCGVCSSVCPRGVLNLENGPKATRVLDEVSLVNMLHDKNKA